MTAPAARFLGFALDRQPFRLDLAAVDAVTRGLPVTPLAGAPAALAGLVSHHGRVLPLVDLRRRLGLAPGRAAGERMQVIVVPAGGAACLDVADYVDLPDAGSGELLDLISLLELDEGSGGRTGGAP